MAESVGDRGGGVLFKRYLGWCQHKGFLGNDKGTKHNEDSNECDQVDREVDEGDQFYC